MNELMRSSVMGLLLGQFSSPLPISQKEPVAYLYNGVRLPALPEWDRETYPYAVIIGEGYLWVTSVIPTVGYGATDISGKHEVYSAQDGKYVKTSEGDKANNINALPIWGSVDIYYDDYVPDAGGTVFLAASDPIPVYE